MAYTYDDYITYDQNSASEFPTYLSRLRLHIREVSQQIGPDTAGADMNVQRSALIEYKAQLLGELEKANASPLNRTGGGVSLASFERQS